MSLSRETLLELMAYADGELEGDAVGRIEALLASSSDARRVVESIARVGDELERVYPRPEGAAYETIADRVMLGVARIQAEAPEQHLPRAGKLTDLRGVRERRVKVGAAVLAAVALAAGIVLTAWHTDQGAPGAVVAGNVGVSAQMIAPVPAPPPRAPGSSASGIAAPSVAGVEVEQVDSARDVQVYYLPSMGGNGAASSVMVWIDDKGPASP
jgi:anti-sigma factor RsiW